MWDRISNSKLPITAAQCCVAKLTEIREQIGALSAELAAVEDWDEDTQDDIYLRLVSSAISLI
ncbi:hypothetical protein YWS52_06700 [Chitiniphilus shinanonensis]